MKAPTSPALDPASVPDRNTSSYPEPLRRKCLGQSWKKLGDACGLKNFGVNLVTLPPGVQSSLRHWHTHEDEFVYILSGVATLRSDAGEQQLTAGMCAGFPAGSEDGHCLVNRSSQPVIYLEMGDRNPADHCYYTDDDLLLLESNGKTISVHKDGTPYPE